MNLVDNAHIFIEVMTKLDLTSLYNLSLTCQRVNSLVNDRWFWKRIYQRDICDLSKDCEDICDDPKDLYRVKSTYIIIFATLETCVLHEESLKEWSNISSNVLSHYNFTIKTYQFKSIRNIEKIVRGDLKHWMRWFPCILLFPLDEWKSGTLDRCFVYGKGTETMNGWNKHYPSFLSNVPEITTSSYIISKERVSKWLKDILKNEIKRIH